MRRTSPRPFRARSPLVGFAVWLSFVPLWAEDEVGEGGVSTREAVQTVPTHRVARAEAANPAVFSSSLPLRLVGAFPMVSEGMTVVAPLGVERQEWQDPSSDRPNAPEARRIVTPTGVPGLSPIIFELESEHSRMLTEFCTDRLPGGESHRDILIDHEDPGDPLEKALWALGERVLYREFRRYFRAELKDRFESDPSLSFEEYQDIRDKIGHLGRGGRAEDLVLEERRTELRNEYLDATTGDPERDLPILQWGPLVLDDTGGVNVDVTRLDGSKTLSQFDLAFAPSEEAFGRRAGESILFPDERYRVRSRIKLNPDFREVGRDWNAALGKLSASFEIDWQAPVLERRSFSTEIGGSIDAEGRYGLYLNLVIYGK